MSKIQSVNINKIFLLRLTTIGRLIKYLKITICKLEEEANAIINCVRNNNQIDLFDNTNNKESNEQENRI